MSVVIKFLVYIILNSTYYPKSFTVTLLSVIINYMLPHIISYYLLQISGNPNCFLICIYKYICIYVCVYYVYILISDNLLPFLIINDGEFNANLKLCMFRDLILNYPFSVINALAKEQHLGVFQMLIN